MRLQIHKIEMILVIACAASISVARGFLYFSILDRAKGRIGAKNEGRGEERDKILALNPMTLKNLFAWLGWHSNFN